MQGKISVTQIFTLCDRLAESAEGIRMVVMVLALG
jgi:hypothetical protein